MYTEPGNSPKGSLIVFSCAPGAPNAATVRATPSSNDATMSLSVQSFSDGGPDSPASVVAPNQWAPPTMWLTSSRTFHDLHGVGSSSWSRFTLERISRVEANALERFSVTMVGLLSSRLRARIVERDRGGRPMPRRRRRRVLALRLHPPADDPRRRSHRPAITKSAPRPTSRPGSALLPVDARVAEAPGEGAAGVRALDAARTVLLVAVDTGPVGAAAVGEDATTTTLPCIVGCTRQW